MQCVLKLLLITSIVVIGAPDVTAQTLNLGGTRPPELTGYSFGHALLDELVAEIEEPVLNPSASLRSSEPLTALSLDAQRAVRVVAFLLLERAEALGDDGSAAFLSGLTLARSRLEVDHWLFEVIEPPEHSSEPPPNVELHLRDFVQSVADLRDQLTRFDSAEPMDRTLAAAFFPLAVLSRQRGNATPPASIVIIDDLRQWNASSTLSARSQSACATILDYLARGMEFAEFRPTIIEQCAILDGLRQTERALVAAVWLDAADQRALRDFADAALIQFEDKVARESGRESLLYISRLASILDRLTQLSQFNRDRVNVEAVAHALVSFEASNSRVIDDAVQTRILRALDDMIAFRMLPPVELRGSLRVPARKLENMLRDGEAALIEDLQRLSVDRTALSDPDCLSRLVSQHNLLHAIGCLRASPDWRDAIASIFRPDAERFDAQVLRLATNLLDPGQRSEAARTLARLDREIHFLMSLPLEDGLRSRDTAVEAIVGGTSEGLVEVVDQTRKQWANAWAMDGNGGDESNKLWTLYEVLRAARDCGGDSRLLQAATRLNAEMWWEVPVEIVESSQADLNARIRLACQHVISDRFDEARQQLETMVERSSIGFLVGILDSTLSKETRSDAQRPLGIIASPIVDSRTVPAFPRFLTRDVLARLCRYTIEGHHARTNDRATLANECDRYVSSLVQGVLDDLDRAN